MSTTHQFRREIGWFDGVMLVAGTMIGSGIFIVSADIARQVGSSGFLLLVWALSGFLTLVAALAYGELTGLYPRAGGQYVFLREAYNPLVAFLYGWTLFLVIQTGTIAAVAVAFAKFSSVFFPNLGEDRLLVQAGRLHISAAQVLAISVIAVLTLVNIGGVWGGKWIQTILGSAKIVALFGLIAFGFSCWEEDAVAENLRQLWDAVRTTVQADGTVVRMPLEGWALVAAIGMAMVGSLFSMDAWNNITFAGDEVVNARKTLARSMAIGTALVTVIYLLMNVVYLLHLPLRGVPNDDTRNLFTRGIQFATHDRVGVAVADALAGHTAVLIVAALIVVSTFSCLNGLILAGARVYYKMAEDGLFFSRMQRLNARGVPQAALLLQGGWSSLLVLSGTYSNLLDYVVFAVLLFYLITIAAVFVLRRKYPHAERPYRAWGYPVLPLIYLATVALICIILLMYKPTYTWPGLIIVALGLPAYAWFRKKKQPADSGNRSG
ncbi:MAG: amino acid permease [Chitinophagales bacterium]|nr:amino acid permease [Chitinophagales bacterium]MDW8393367.1 amino acid permease [Chitinophagales bacterium]